MSSTFPLLTTTRLQLRQLTGADAEALQILRSDAIVNRYLDHRPKTITLEEAVDFIVNINQKIATGESFYWAISERGSDLLIGTTCLFHFSEDKKKAEIGYELSPHVHGKGIMEEAVTKVMEYAFSQLQVQTLEAYINAQNVNSIKLVERNNFKPTSAEGRTDAEGMVLYALQNPYG